MDISIVVPLYNESQSVRPLSEAIIRAVEPIDRRFEIILVDDGSQDGTFERASQLAGEDDRFRVIKFQRNFGQTAALSAGFDHARGRIIVTLDGDLQNDPDDIGRLVEKLEEGYDVVTGWRKDRKDKLWSRKIPSRAANWLIRTVTGAPIIDNGCALRVYRAEVLKTLPLYSEMHRLLPTILYMSDVRIAQLEVKHHPRKYGTGKYGLMRIYKVIIDLMVIMMITRAVRFPLFGFGHAGLAAAGVGGAAAAAAFAQLAFAPDSSVVVYLGTSMLWSSLSLALLMFGFLCVLIYSRANLTVTNLLTIDRLGTRGT